MATMTLQEAQASLPEIIHGLTPGEEVLITENEQPVAKLIQIVPEPPKKKRILGQRKGSVLHMAPDFDAPLEDFKEYRE